MKKKTKTSAKPKTVRAARGDSELSREVKELTRIIERFVAAVEADRDRLAQLEKESKESQGHRRNLSRALEDAFAASLPRAMKARNINIRREDIHMRVQKSNHTREFDFVAPNGEVTLVGEVKTHLKRKDVSDLGYALTHEFRGLFPEYAGLPIYGVVCGGLIDDAAARLAREQGFIILQMEGADLHPATGKEYSPKAY